MPNLTSVGLTSGVPTTGTGTVSTLDAVIAVLPAALAANGGLKVEGVASGVAVPISVATVPTHAVTQSGTWTIQPGNTANTTAWKVDNTAALDKGAGTGGSATQRVIIDSSQTEGSAYETVAASQTAQVMGATGATGDYLSHVIVSPGTAGCGVVTVLDNATTIAAFPGGGTTALSNLIPFIIPIGITSTSGAWKITTGANVTCTAVGRFT